MSFGCETDFGKGNEMNELARYTVTRGTDELGGRFATGPLTFIRTNDLGKAQKEVIARGGEVIDHKEKRAWIPSIGWFDAEEYIAVGLACDRKLDD